MQKIGGNSNEKFLKKFSEISIDKLFVIFYNVLMHRGSQLLLPHNEKNYIYKERENSYEQRTRLA